MKDITHFPINSFKNMLDWLPGDLVKLGLDFGLWTIHFLPPDLVG